MRSPLFVGLLCLGALLAGFAIARRGDAARDPGAPPAASSSENLRGQIRKLIDEEVTGLETEEQVDAYLARLEKRAITRGRVTALEVEPGLAAIARLTKLSPQQLERKHHAFSQRMAKLSKQPAPSN